MEVRTLPDPAAVAEAGAALFAGALRAEPDLAAAIATGNSPIAMYARLAEMRAAGAVDASRMRAFQLDAYRGTPDDDPRSLWGWMERAFVRPMGLAPGQVRRLDAMTDDPEGECRRYDAAIAAAGGLGLAVLGLGPNGHLAFNEPPCGPDAPSRPVRLTPETVRSNAAYWGSEDAVPRGALTMGTAPILGARRVLLLVTGAAKHAVLRRAVEGPMTPDLPASWIQGHGRATVLCDRAAWEGA